MIYPSFTSTEFHRASLMCPLCDYKMTNFGDYFICPTSIYYTLNTWNYEKARATHHNVYYEYDNNSKRYEPKVESIHITPLVEAKVDFQKKSIRIRVTVNSQQNWNYSDTVISYDPLTQDPVDICKSFALL